MLTATMEDYLKAIYYLQEESEGRVQTLTLANQMGVQSPTVTSMMNKLSDRDLVEYEPYKGVELTDTGASIALEVIRHHRLLEQYLTEHLGYDWSQVHDEADRLEHHISDQFIDRIAEQLEDPDIDPHGDPIPTAELEVSSAQCRKTLEDHQEGDRIRIERVRDQKPAVLQYLSRHGIRPGTSGEIVEVAPFGMVTINPDDYDGVVALPSEIADSVCARSRAEDTE